MERESSPLQKVYGRGYFDGQRKAMEAMNNARILSVENNLTGMGKKVLECVPQAETWTAAQIIAEVRRKGSGADCRVVGQTINELLRSGVIREPKRGEFVRVSQKPKLASVKADPIAEPVPFVKDDLPDPAPIKTTPNEVADPMSKVIEIAASMRELAKSATQIADEIESVALEMEGRIEKMHADTNKLRQLQDLLKNLNN